jgi:hypothetical protein
MTQPVYYLDVSIHGYDAEVLVNGAPVVSCGKEFPFRAFPTVSEWIVEGDNEVAIAISDAGFRETKRVDPSGTEVLSGPKPAGENERARVLLCRGELGDVPDLAEQDIVCAVELVPPPAGEPLLVPARVANRGAISPAFGRWAWQDAAVLVLDDALLAELLALAQSICTGLEQRDVAPMASLMATKFAEIAPCYGMKAEDAAAAMRNAMNGFVSHVDWAVAPVERDALDARLCCDGRIVELRNADGQPLVRQRGSCEGETWSLPMFVARIGGALQIVR